MKFLINKSKKEDQISDHDLILKYRNSHDNSYVGTLFTRYTHLVYGAAMKYMKNEEDSKDIVMEVFEKLIPELKRHDIKNFKGWLYSVTKNLCLMKIRKEDTTKKHELEFIKSESEFMENQLPLHLNNVDKQPEVNKKLEQGIASLKEEQRECIELFYINGNCYQEIAAKTGYSLKQVKSYIQNGKRNIKIYLTDSYE